MLTTRLFHRVAITPSFTRLVKSGSTHGLIFLSNVGAEVNERHARARAPQIERRLGRRVAAADDDDVLVERLVPFAIDVRHVRQRLRRAR